MNRFADIKAWRTVRST